MDTQDLFQDQTQVLSNEHEEDHNNHGVEDSSKSFSSPMEEDTQTTVNASVYQTAEPVQAQPVTAIQGYSSSSSLLTSPSLTSVHVETPTFKPKQPRPIPISTSIQSPELSGKRQRRANSLYGDYELDSDQPGPNKGGPQAPVQVVVATSPVMARPPATIVSPHLPKKIVRAVNPAEVIAPPNIVVEMKKKLPKGYTYEPVGAHQMAHAQQQQQQQQQQQHQPVVSAAIPTSHHEEPSAKRRKMESGQPMATIHHPQQQHHQQQIHHQQQPQHHHVVEQHHHQAPNFLYSAPTHSVSPAATLHQTTTHGGHVPPATITALYQRKQQKPPKPHKIPKLPKPFKPHKEKIPKIPGAKKKQPKPTIKSVKKYLKNELSQIDSQIAMVTEAMEPGSIISDEIFLFPVQTIIPQAVSYLAFGGPPPPVVPSPQHSQQPLSYQSPQPIDPNVAAYDFSGSAAAAARLQRPKIPKLPKQKKSSAYDKFEEDDDDGPKKPKIPGMKKKKEERAAGGYVGPGRPPKRPTNPYDIAEDDDMYQSPTYGNNVYAPPKQRHVQPQAPVQQLTPASYAPGAAPITFTPTESLPLEPALAECHRILIDLRKHADAAPFNQPVDPIALNIPDYFKIIKNPMDLGTIMTNLEAGDYMSPEEVADDVALIWRNCRTFNPGEHPVVKMAEKLDHYFSRRYQRAFSRPPPAPAPSHLHQPHQSPVVPSHLHQPHQTAVPSHLHQPHQAAVPSHLHQAPIPAPLPPTPVTRRVAPPPQLLPPPIMTAPPPLQPTPAPTDPSKAIMAETINELKESMKRVREELTNLRQTQSQKPTPSKNNNTKDSLPRELRELPATRERRAPAPPPGKKEKESSSSSTTSSKREVEAPTPKRRGAAPKAVKEMSFEEKANLSTAINTLEPNHLGKVVQIIQAAMPHLAKNSPDEIEIDIDSLDAATLRKLETFVKSVNKPAPAPKGGRKGAKKDKLSESGEQQRLQQLQQQFQEQGLLAPIPGISSPTTTAPPTIPPPNAGLPSEGLRRDETEVVDVDIDDSHTLNFNSGDTAMSPSMTTNLSTTPAPTQPTTTHPPFPSAGKGGKGGKGPAANLIKKDDSDSDSSSSSSSSDSDSDSDDESKKKSSVIVPTKTEVKEVELKNLEGWNTQQKQEQTSETATGTSSAWSEFQNRDHQNKMRERERQEEEEREKQARAKRDAELKLLEEEQKAEIRRQEEEKIRQEAEAKVEAERQLQEQKEAERAAREQTAQVNLMEQSNMMSSFEMDAPKSGSNSLFKLKDG